MNWALGNGGIAWISLFGIGASFRGLVAGGITNFVFGKKK
jgi:predicted benzoate:H+ symporter BenE